MSPEGWIALGERMPTEADADAQQCVLVWHELSGCLICNVHNIHSNSFLTHWRPLPSRPSTPTSGRCGCEGAGTGRSGTAQRDQPEVP